MPMIFMTCVNSLAVVYFAILLPFLPAKTASAQQSGDSCESAFQLALFWCHSRSRLQLAGAAYLGLTFTCDLVANILSSEKASAIYPDRRDGVQMEQQLRRDKLSVCQQAQMWRALQAGAAQLLSSVEVTRSPSREMAHIVNDRQGCGWCYMHITIDNRREYQGTRLLN